MAWCWHLFWGLVVYATAIQLGRAVALAGEWIGKAIVQHDQALLTLQREALSRARPGGRA